MLARRIGRPIPEEHLADDADGAAAERAEELIGVGARRDNDFPGVKRLPGRAHLHAIG